MDGTLGHAQTNTTQQMSNTVGVLVGWDLPGGWVSAVPGRVTATLAQPGATEHVFITKHNGNEWFRAGFCDVGAVPGWVTATLAPPDAAEHVFIREPI